jgi:hypothetical protein
MMIMRNCLPLLLILLPLTSAAAANGKTVIPNGNFELPLPQDKSRPATWEYDVANKKLADGDFALDRSIVKRGKNSVRVAFVEAQGYAGVIQFLDATRLAGRTIVFSGWIRRSAKSSVAGIWIAINDAQKKRLTYQNSYEVPHDDLNRFDFHRVEIKVPETATSLMIGAAIYEKDGTMWADDLRIDLIEKRP